MFNNEANGHPKDPRIAEAVEKNKEEAEEYLRDPERAQRLIDDATKKAAKEAKHKGPLARVWTYLTAFFRLLQAYIRGKYRDISWASIVSITAAIIYFISPLDLIPDIIPVLGFIDDAAVIAFVVSQVRDALLDFLLWEEMQATKNSLAQLLIILGRPIEEFTITEQDAFILALSQLVNIDPRLIRIVDIARGSVRITLEMPEEAAQLLLSSYLNGDPLLKSFGVEKVEIQKVVTPISTQSGKYDDARPTSILFLAADPTDASRLRLGEELREIQEKLRLAKSREQFKLEQRMSVRPADISQALLDVQPQIVHFSGHGTAAGALCFEDLMGKTHLVEPEALAALFEQFSDQIYCVVLNACYSESQASAIAAHIEYVVGMNQAIGDEAAIAFAVGFYQGLGAKRNIEYAYKLGRIQIRLQGIPEHLTPVLIKNGKPSSK